MGLVYHTINIRSMLYKYLNIALQDLYTMYSGSAPPPYIIKIFSNVPSKSLRLRLRLHFLGVFG